MQSTPGQGTEMEVRLPLTELRGQPKSEGVPPVRAGDQRILLVEDNPLVRESCALRLEASGYLMSAVEDGEAALKLVSERQFDLILMDVDLPGANGVTVAAQMRAEQPDLDVIFVTGNVRNQALKNICADDLVIPKPIDFAELTHAISEVERRS